MKPGRISLPLQSTVSAWGNLPRSVSVSPTPAIFSPSTATVPSQITLFACPRVTTIACSYRFVIPFPPLERSVFLKGRQLGRGALSHGDRADEALQGADRTAYALRCIRVEVIVLIRADCQIRTACAVSALHTH